MASAFISPDVKSVATMAVVGAAARGLLGAVAAAVNAEKGEKFSAAVRGSFRGVGTGLLTGAAIGVIYPTALPIASRMIG